MTKHNGSITLETDIAAVENELAEHYVGAPSQVALDVLPRSSLVEMMAQERFGYVQGYIKLRFAVKGLRNQGMNAEAEAQFKRMQSFLSSIAAIDKDVPEAKAVMQELLNQETGRKVMLDKMQAQEL